MVEPTFGASVINATPFVTGPLMEAVTGPLLGFDTDSCFKLLFDCPSDSSLTLGQVS